ncbi:MAG: hypothetical protein IBX61_08390 [Thermoleophilia bacterium]|nr:hypothetical protein [Thermoleophilia bacterium]
MDMITMAELTALSVRNPGWCVSLYMTAHPRGRESEQDPLRFKNLLGEAEERLLAEGLRSPDVREMLKPARSLLQDSGFWRRQSEGLAAFFTPERFYLYRLPIPFEDLVVVSEVFHLKPLLLFFAGDGHFFILALSQKQVRLLEGTRYTVDGIDLKNMPRSLADALKYEDFEKQLQFHTGTSGGRGKRAAVFHGHDIGDEDKDRILRWFHRIDGEISGLLKGERSPLVLAGVEYLFPLYKAANSYPALLDEGVRGNPDELKPEDLHSQAWPLVRSIFTEAREESVSRYSRLAGTGRATADVNEAVLAAHHGRVDVLFVAANVQVWGSFAPGMKSVRVHEKREPGDEDLLDMAAIQVILKGGTVYPVAPDQMPGHALLAAVLRY